MAIDPDTLLAGPRGRRVCLEFAREQLGTGPDDWELGHAIVIAAADLDPRRGSTRVLVSTTGADEEPTESPTAADVARLLEAVPLEAVPLGAARSALLLAVAVDTARYWQEPDGEDVLAGLPELRGSLARAAARLAASPSAAWWDTPFDRTAQWEVDFAGIPHTEPTTAAQTLSTWRTAQLAEEADAARTRPADPAAPFSGSWWSKPPTALTRTTRALDSSPVGLTLVEDSMGWDQATVAEVRVPDGARVHEITGAEDWAELCGRYPLEVTASRRHDWYRTTGRAGRWAIPDWELVAHRYDAVHLTVAGYLSAAGRALPIDGNLSTVLAGWDPDQTFWLADVPRDPRTRAEWRRARESGWLPGRR
ncbi:MAG: hypothetical protein H7146_02180 [Burkholderiaceae bacterium]|nr:hypothetical protein [Microbacteriaceae bacterium]